MQQRAILRRKTTSVLQSPNLILNLTTESAKVKILPPPPKAFRDPDSERIKAEKTKVDKIEADKNIKVDKNNMVDKTKERNGKVKRNQQNSLAHQVKELQLGKRNV